MARTVRHSSNRYKKFCRRIDSKEALGRLPVVTPGLVMTAGKGGAEWFISSQVPIQHLKAVHRKKVLIKFNFPFVHS